MILVTGGAGYIGSHTVVALLEAGHEVVVYDNLCNSSAVSLQRVETITGKAVTLVKGDVCDAEALTRVFQNYPIEAVMHFAGLKAVGESVAQPLRYYSNNVAGTLTLCQVMAAHNVKQLVFSSSATVYGDPQQVPLLESSPTGATTNPYGTSKYMVERLLNDVAIADPQWSIAILRYFNPVGAHPSGLIGEDPRGTPNNLVPYIAQVAVGKLAQLQIYGDDYPTSDGTGVRDYIHVMDLASGHVAALQKLTEFDAAVVTVNLGTGQGYSVHDMVNAFAEVADRPIPYQVVARRPGDIATCYADVSYAERLLQWRAQRGLREMMEDTWRWQQQNPNGYDA